MDRKIMTEDMVGVLLLSFCVGFLIVKLFVDDLPVQLVLSAIITAISISVYLVAESSGLDKDG